MNEWLPPLIRDSMTPVEYLAANGHLDLHPTEQISEDDTKFKQATLRWQEFAGLVPDGQFGPVSRSRTLDKRCALPDLNRGFIKDDSGKWCEWKAEACTAQWKVTGNKLTAAHNGMKFSTLSASDTDSAWWAALKSWMNVCGVLFERAPWTGDKCANFWHKALVIDGSGQVLAWHYLPGCGLDASGRLEGRFDTGERWTAQYFQGVCAHECGHGLGLEHDSSSSALMYPYARESVYLPQPRDIARVVTRYGEPSVPGGPVDPQPTTIEQRLAALEQGALMQRVTNATVNERLRQLESRT